MLEDYLEMRSREAKVFRSSIYLSLIAQDNLLETKGSSRIRELLLYLIGDYFQFGVDPQDKALFQKQESFLAFNVSREFDYKPLLQQIRMLTLIHEPMTCNIRSCQRIDQDDGDTYILTSDVSITITMLSMSVMYPHMLDDAVFMEKAVGKVLKYTAKTIVTFTPDNKILSLTSERDYADAWYNLLQDIVMTAKVIKEMNNNFNTPNLIC